MGQFELGTFCKWVGAGCAVYGMITRNYYVIGGGAVLAYVGNTLSRSDLGIKKENGLEKGIKGS